MRKAVTTNSSRNTIWGPFEVLANSMERTFCDKVYALCDYYLAGEIPHRQSRHVYDLRKLSRCTSLDENLAALMRTVREQRLEGYRCPSAEPEMDIPVLLEHIAAKEAYRHDYEHVTAPLLYETMPTTRRPRFLGILRRSCGGKRFRRRGGRRPSPLSCRWTPAPSPKCARLPRPRPAWAGSRCAWWSQTPNKR